MAHKGKLYPWAPGRDLNLFWPAPWLATRYKSNDYIASGLLAHEYDDGIEQDGDLIYDSVHGSVRYNFKPKKLSHRTSFWWMRGGSPQNLINSITSGSLVVDGVDTGVEHFSFGLGIQGNVLVGLQLFGPGGSGSLIRLDLGLFEPLKWAEL